MPILLGHVVILAAVAAAAVSPAADAGTARVEPSRTLATTSGLAVPAVGLGLAARLGRDPVEQAAALGYRLFDTAQASEWYDEVGVGEGLAAGGALSADRRATTWVTTKVHPRDFGIQSTHKVCKQSLLNLGLDYIDAVLLHYKACWGDLCRGSSPEGTWKDAWRALEKLHTQGQVRVLGASNADVHFLEALWKYAKVKPELVQNRMDPFVQDRQAREWCKTHDVIYQCYSSLGTQYRQLEFNPVMESLVLRRIATRHQRSVAEVVLQWQLQLGLAVIPRTRNPERMAKNLALGETTGDWLTKEEMNEIDGLGGADPALARSGGKEL